MKLFIVQREKIKAIPNLIHSRNKRENTACSILLFVNRDLSLNSLNILILT